MKRVRAMIHGFVQRVGFRYYVKSNADKLGVTGWVKNNLDGTVEAVFEGDDHTIGQLIEACKRGPILSWVEHVETMEEKPTNEFDKFSILR